MTERLIIKDATIITLDDDNRIVAGSVVIEQGRIAEILPSSSPISESDFDEVIDGRGCVLLPGFVQTHIHLCQTLFRGAADDLALIDWLKQRVWPMEAAHTPASLYASARLGIAELIRGGTTCALTMETVNHTEAVFRAQRAFQGHRETKIKGRAQKETITFPAGSILVRASQPLATLASYLLEAESDDGLVNWNFLDAYLEKGKVYPIYRATQEVKAASRLSSTP